MQNFHDIEIEKQLLGILLSFKNYQEEIFLNINAEHFYNNVNKLIFKTAKKLYEEEKGVDILTVSQTLLTDTVIAKEGGAYFITTLTSNVASGVNFMTYVRILKELFLKRSMYLLFHTGIKDLGTEKDIFDVFNEFNNSIEKLFNLKDNELFDVNEIILKRLDEISELEEDKLIGISTGFRKVDEITSGWQGGDLIILAARPSMGKTAISLHFAKHPTLIEDKNVLYFSLEMAKERIADRLISLETGINSKRIQHNRLNSDDWHIIDNTIPIYQDSNFTINDKSDLTIEDIKNISIIEDKKKKIDLIVVDYLQIIQFSQNSGNTTNDKVTHISKNLKSLAKRLNCPVIALSQLRRTQNEKPQLTDLRDSGAIEQDADIVLFVHRYDYENRNCELEQKNLIELIFAKHRNGEIGMTEIYRADDWSKFYQNVNELEDAPY